MPFKDLREFIAKLEGEGEAIKIEEEVDWHLEASELAPREIVAALRVRMQSIEASRGGGGSGDR
jgi:UbiD family decarboxylase